jgi:hypothetical protein
VQKQKEKEKEKRKKPTALNFSLDGTAGTLTTPSQPLFLNLSTGFNFGTNKRKRMLRSMVKKVDEDYRDDYFAQSSPKEDDLSPDFSFSDDDSFLIEVTISSSWLFSFVLSGSFRDRYLSLPPLTRLQLPQAQTFYDLWTGANSPLFSAAWSA